MTPTDLTTALTEVREAVDVPAPDRVALQARVRTERRRRTATRATLAVAGLAAAAAVVAGTVQALPEDEATPVASAPPVEVADPTEVVGFVVDDRLVVAGPGGFTSTGVPARNVLGVLDGRVILADGTGALVAVPVSEAGVPDEPVRLGAGLRAYLDRPGLRVVSQETDDTYRSWSPRDGWSDLDLDPVGDGMAVGFDGEHRVDSGADGLTLVGPDGPVRTLPVGGGVVHQDLAGGVVAVDTLRGARFFAADTGRLLARVPGQAYAGRLSPDGTSYARSTAAGVVLIDPATGHRRPVDTVGGAPADQVAWTNMVTFFVTTRDDDGTGTLQECDAVERACRLLYEDPTGTLKLTS